LLFKKKEEMVSIIEKNYYNRSKDELLVEIKQNPYAFSSKMAR
jgi:hypothetical protein